MGVEFHPDEVANAWDYLRTLKPFKRWKLPTSDSIKFRVSRHADRYGHYEVKRGEPFPEIVISSKLVLTYSDMLNVLSHEAIHVYQRQARLETNNTQHNADFRARAKRVCALHGWDYDTFI